MTTDKTPGGARLAARAHNRYKLECLCSQMTLGVLVLGMAARLQALIDGR